MSRLASSLPDDVADLLSRNGGVFLLADAQAAGIGHSRINRLVKRGVLVALVRGCYAAAERVARLDAWEMHRQKARAFALASGMECFVTGWAAAVHWKLRPAGRVPRLPTVIVLREHGHGRGSTTVNGRTMLADVPDQHLHMARPKLGGRRWGVVGAAWAAADVARSAPVPDALIVADSAVRAGADLSSVLEHMSRWGAVARARWVVVQKQSDREFRLRRLGLDLVRYGWTDAYYRRSVVAEKFIAVLRDNPPRSEPIRWWKDVPDGRPVEPEPEDWPSSYPSGLVLPAGWNVERDPLRLPLEGQDFEVDFDDPDVT